MQKFMYHLRFFMVVVLFVPTFAMASAITIHKPTEGECLEAESTYRIEWSGSSNDHVALSYTSTSTQPETYVSSPIAEGHPVTANFFNWKVPTGKTVDNGKIWVETHDDKHNFVAISSQLIAIDDSPPVVPVLSAMGTLTSITLTWTKAVDEGCEGLKKYKIFRDGVLLDEVDKTTQRYTDHSVTANEEYEYYIQAVDDFVTVASNTLSVNAKPPTPTPTPSSKSPSPSPSVSITPAAAIIATNKPTPTPSPSPSISIQQPELKTVQIDGQNAAVNFDAPLELDHGQTIRIEGVGLPNTKVIIRLFSQERLYETTTDATGKWVYNVKTNEVEPGAHRITVATKDALGRTSQQKEVLQFVSIDPGQAPISIATQAIPRQSSAYNWPQTLIVFILIGSAVAALRYKVFTKKTRLVPVTHYHS